MPYELKFTIEDLPHSTNSLGRKHWGAKLKESRKWERLVWETVIFGGYPKPPSPLKKAKISLTRHSSREPDFDGLVSTFKHVLDGLKNAKIIVDDKMSVIGQPNYKWECAPRNKGKITVHVQGEE